MKAKGTYTVKKWEESTYQQMAPEKKMTKASVEYGFTGEIDGKGLVEYLMFYGHFDPKDQHNSSASYVDSFILMVHYQESREALSSKTTARLKAERQERHCELPKAQAPVNSMVFMELEYIWPIEKVVILSWNTISSNGS